MVKFLLRQRVGDVLGRHRAEQLIVLAGLLRDGDADAGQQLGQILGLALQLGFLAQVRLALLLDDLLVGFGGRHGQPLGQQEIAGVAGGDLHHLAAAAQLFDVFSENDFHVRFLPP